MAESTTLSILYVRALVEAVEQAGVPGDVFLSGTGFDTAVLDDTSRRLSFADWCALLERGLRLTEDDALGLHMGELANATTYGLSAHLVAHATSMREGIATLLKFHRLLADTPPLTFREDGARAMLLHEAHPAPPRVERLLAEFTLTSFYRMVLYFGRGTSPYEVAFAYPAPDHHREYTRVFDGHERFGRAFTGVVFDRKLLGTSQPNQDPDLHAALQTQAERRAARLDDSIAYSQRVRAYLVAQKNPGSHDMESVAHAVGLSGRSLRRRLREEGASYAEIFKDARAEVAKGLILDDGPMKSVACALGFSDSSSFQHAFKKWTGMTPGEYRLRNRNPNGSKTT